MCRPVSGAGGLILSSKLLEAKEAINSIDFFCSLVEAKGPIISLDFFYLLSPSITLLALRKTLA